jgi:hypothetical protein
LKKYFLKKLTFAIFIVNLQNILALKNEIVNEILTISMHISSFCLHISVWTSKPSVVEQRSCVAR